MPTALHIPLEPTRPQDVTIEQVQSLETFKHYTAEEAQALIDVLKFFTAAVYAHWQHSDRTQQHTKIIPLDTALKKAA